MEKIPHPRKKISLWRVVLWSSLGIENVLVIALIWMRTQLEFYQPIGAVMSPSEVAALAKALISLRWVLMAPWLVLANGLGISLRAFLLWRTDRSKSYLIMICLFAVFGIAGYFLTHRLLFHQRWIAYPMVFQSQVLEGQSCRGPDIFLQWGDEGCAYIQDRLKVETEPRRREAAIAALGYLECPGREAFLREKLRDSNESLYVRVQSASALDWLSEGRLKPETEAYLLELEKEGKELTLVANIRTWLRFNENRRARPRELYEILFPSHCFRISPDEKQMEEVEKKVKRASDP